MSSYLARYSFIICSCTARFFAEAWARLAVVIIVIGFGQLVIGNSQWSSSTMLTLCRPSLPQDRAHGASPAGKSGCPCPGWSRSKLAGWTSRSRKSPTPQRTIFGPGEKVTSLNISSAYLMAYQFHFLPRLCDHYNLHFCIPDILKSNKKYKKQFFLIFSQ